MIGLVVVVMCSAMTIEFFACLANSMGYSYRQIKYWCCGSFRDVKKFGGLSPPKSAYG
jgi:hypothetical protein